MIIKKSKRLLTLIKSVSIHSGRKLMDVLIYRSKSKIELIFYLHILSQ